MIDTWPSKDLEPVFRCPLCNGAKRSLLYPNLTDRVFRTALGAWNLYRCEDCGSGYLDPRPTASSIGRAYAMYYTHEPSERPIIHRKGVLQSILHDAINGYRNARYKTNHQPAIRIGRWLIPLFPPLHAWVDAKYRHLKPPTAGARLLDVGCGHGGFIKLAKEIGWEAEGIDFDPKAVQAARARGLNVRCGTVKELAERADQYDVITLSHVIEHVHEPLDLLLDLYRLLKPSGQLWLETPNLNSLGAAMFGRNWRGLEPPRHLVLFNPKSLRKGLEYAGFRQVKQRWRGLMLIEVFELSAAIRDGRDVRATLLQIKPRLQHIPAEVYEMLVPSRREFLTMIATK